MREPPLSLRGKAQRQAENRCMNDSQLVVTVLLAGGVVFVAIFFSVIVASVRESKANEPPAGLGH
jgi:hypothetical protein